MPRDSYEDDEEGSDDPENPGEQDMDEDDEEGPDVIECPYCGAEISEDAVQCPRCRTYLSQEDAPRRRKPPWIRITAAVLVVVILVVWVLWG